VSGRVLLLTGARGAGKSTVCSKVVTLARARGYVCRGVITRRSGPDERTVIRVRDGVARPLTVAPQVGASVVQGRYHFDPRTLAWGREILRQATPCDLFVVDELGPLELIRGQGWAPALDVLREGEYRLAVVVVRPALVGRVRRRLDGELAALSVTPANRDDLPHEILSALEDG
jgi:nucleoside-triphosphatase THEP1